MRPQPGRAVLPLLVAPLLVAHILIGFTQPLGANEQPSDAADGKLTIDALWVGGLLVDAGGDPVDGGRVELFPLRDSYRASVALLTEGPPSPVAHAFSDAGGRYRVRAPSPGIYRLVARADGLVPMQRRPLVLTRSTLAGGLELAPARLLPDAGLELLIQTPDGEPAPHAWAVALPNLSSPWVTAHWTPQAARGWRPHPRFGQAGADGRVRLPRAEGEPLDLHAPQTAPKLAITEAVDISLGAVEARTVTVVATDGTALRNMVALQGERPWPAGLTDADGVLELLTQGVETVPLTLLAADGRRLDTAVGLDPPETLEVPPPWSAPGRLVDAGTGEPIPQGLIWRLDDPGRYAESDPAGNFLLTGIGETAAFQAEADGYVPRRFELRSPSEAPRTMDIPLTPAVSVRGRVTTPAGAPVGRVHLEALAPRDHERPFHQADRIDRRAASASDGRFELGPLEPGVTYHLRSSRSGFASDVVLFTAPHSPSAPTWLGVVLRPRVDAFGWVVDSSDHPLPEAQIELRQAGGDRVAAAGKGGDDGGFELQGVPEGTFDLVVSRRGFAPTTVRGLAVTAGEGPVDLGTVALRPGATIAGRVEDRSGTPVAGARVFAVPPEAPHPDDDRLAALPDDQGARSGPDGRFLVEDLSPEEPVDLRVLGPSHIPTWVRRVESSRGNVPGDSGIRIVLETAHPLRGQVLGPEGQGLGGALVAVTSQDILPGSGGRLRGGRSVGRETLTGEDGRFELQGIPAGDALVRVEADGHVPIEALPLTVPAGERPPLELTLELGATVVGRVTSAGLPVPGARIEGAGVTTIADEDGDYRLAGVSPGDVEIDAVHPDHPPVTERLTVEDGVSRLDFELEAGTPVEGSVTDADGLPVAGAQVRLSGHRDGRPLDYRATTAADGAFRLPTVAPGRYAVQARQGGFAESNPAPHLEVARDPVSDLHLVLVRGTTISGRVLGLDFDQRARVRVEARGPGGLGVEGQVDYSGRFRIDGLDNGRWRLTASVDDGRRQTERWVDIDHRVPELEVDLEFDPGFTVTGTVLFGGEPLPESRVSLAGLDIDQERSVTTDHAGTFRIDDLPPGGYRLGIANAAEQLVHNRKLRIEAHRHLNLELGGAEVSGRVRAGGRGLAGALVILEGRPKGDDAVPFLVTGDTASDGTFHLPRVPSGSFRLTARSDGYGQAETELRVKPGEAQTLLDLELEPTPGLVIEVTLAGGAPPQAVHLHVADSAGRPFLGESRRPGADGRVHFPTVPPGIWRIGIGAPGAASAWAEVSLPDQPLVMTLPPAGSLEVQVPAFTDGPRTADVRLTDGAGRPFRTVGPGGRVQDSWRLHGGLTRMDGIPAGTWTASVTDPTGRPLRRTVATAGQGTVSLSLE
ncbi:MAG: carboxypeptidase-like regulatory domain-containing protein [Acidobacteriota bacterium]